LYFNGWRKSSFETTAPTEAITILEAQKKNIKNFSLLSSNKLTVPAVETLLSLGETQIDGFILPGHVSAIIGTNAWKSITENFKKPSVVAGFDAENLITGTLTLIDLLENKKIELKNEYKQIVRDEGNPHAQKLMFDVFEPCDAEWRGIGMIPGSGLKIKDKYKEYDAALKFPVEVPETVEPKGCRCGELLRGLISPYECPLFGKGCKPEHAIGPCMVSSEGPCAAYYKYGK
jgi:hydrogenase expression/formation protein HypD